MCKIFISLKNNTLTRKFTYFFVILFLIFIGMAVISADNAMRFTNTAQRIRQSREFLFHLGQILFTASDAKTEVTEINPSRGKRKWIEFHRKAAAIQQHIESAKTVMNGNPTQLMQLDALKEMVITRMAFLAQFVERRKAEDGEETYIEVVASNKANIVLEEIRKQIVGLSNEENMQMNNLILEQEAETKSFNFKLFTLLLSTLLLISGGFVFLTITLKARRKAESLLEENRNLLQSFLDYSDSVVYIKNLEGKYLLVNREYEKLFGISEAEMQSKYDTDIFEQEDVDRFRVNEKMVINTGKPLVTEESTVGQGAVHTYHSVLFPLYDTEGLVYAVGGMATNITERKRNELALRRAHDLLEIRVDERTKELTKTNSTLQSALNARKRMEEELLQTSQFNYEIISNVGVGIIVYDEQLNHVLWNTYMESLSGIPSHRVIGRSAEKVFPQFGDQGFFTLLRKVLSGDTIATNDIRIELPETSRDFWVSCIFSPHRNAEGEIIGVIGIVRNETSRKRTEENLSFINKQLDTFIYKSSHDLKGPLCSIIGLTMLAKREVTDTEALKLFDLIKGRTEKLDEILKGLIDTMTIKEGRITLEKVDVGQLVDQTIKRLEGADGFERVDFRVKSELQSEFVSDGKIIRSILQSLLSNSIKYQDMTVSHPFVEVRIWENENEILLEISDNGEGIREEIQDKVFDMFFRDASNSPGSGLGLYIVKNGVEKLKGSISLNSKEHMGTTFTIHFPRNIAA